MERILKENKRNKNKIGQELRSEELFRSQKERKKMEELKNLFEYEKDVDSFIEEFL
jgi:hypothetical protein